MIQISKKAWRSPLKKWRSKIIQKALSNESGKKGKEEEGV
jgi:hypothetical protein